MICPIRDAKASEEYLLLLYDSYKVYGTESNTLDKIVKMSLATGNKLYVRKINTYTSKEIQGSEGVIILANDKESFSHKNLEEVRSLNSNIIWIGEFSSPDIERIPLNKFNGIEELKVRKIILDRFSRKSKKNNNSYLLLDEVYPFDNFNLLVEKVDYLYEKGLPFLVNAMPVFQNIHSDAMKRYAEVLRYCQSKGGRIILGSPFIYNEWTKEDELMENLQIAQNTFVDYFVYPIALSIQDTDLYRGDRMKYLDSSSTLILSKNVGVGVTEYNYTFKAFDNVLERVSKEDLITLYSKDLYRDTVIPLVGNEEYDIFKKSVDTFIHMGITFTYPEYLKSEVNLGNNSIINRKNGIDVNGNLVGVNNFITREEFSSIFKNKIVKEEIKTIDLDVFQSIIFVLSFISLVIFIIFFIRNRRIDKRKYFK